ncbi:Uncharacterised protein [Mycobacteroides abscessus subsp. abscessus]|nr:Uncharacterised protein [Mycobacteroides abscessus subsp. abscessus]
MGGIRLRRVKGTERPTTPDTRSGTASAVCQVTTAPQSCPTNVAFPAPTSSRIPRRSSESASML